MTEEENKYEGDVFWYNERDVFFHLRTLRNYGIHHLTVGQEILLHLTDEGKRPQAKEVRVSHRLG